MTNPKNYRFRFAPSPTGYLHVGGARTALYNYLMAKKTGGTFILRIEDTDLERSTPESIEAILEGMKWLGLTWDEGPYFQTKRFGLYKEHVEKLLAEKKAYPCFCTAEELEKKRSLAMAEKRKPMYDRTCFKLSASEVSEKIKQNIPHCIRFYSGDEGEITIHDVVKGPVVVSNKELDDLIIARSDGSPTYNFTVVVDDVTMKMTHIIRGDDHLNNTPRQIQLYQAFNYPLPLFAHVPMILGSDKKRLSKRHGATSVMAYRDMGYLPEALLNYLVRLGWAFEDQEVFTMEQMIEKFTLEAVSKSAGVFNPEKLLWLNGLYIRQLSSSELAKRMIWYLEQKGIKNPDPAILEKAVKCSQEKVKTLVEMVDMIDLFFIDVEPSDDLKQTLVNDQTKTILSSVVKEIEPLTTWSHDSLHAAVSKVVEQTGIGLGKIAQPIRIILSGRKISPSIFDMMEILGKPKTMQRIGKFMS